VVLLLLNPTPLDTTPLHLIALHYITLYCTPLDCNALHCLRCARAHCLSLVCVCSARQQFLLAAVVVLLLLNPTRLDSTPLDCIALHGIAFDVRALIVCLLYVDTKSVCSARQQFLLAAIAVLPVQHPDITRLVQMVLDYAERCGVNWDQLILWKMDIRGAYTLIDNNAPDVQCMAVKLREQLLMLFGCGGFGYSGLPGAFHVLTRAFK